MHGGNQVTLITLRRNAQVHRIVVRISEFHRGFGVGLSMITRLISSLYFHSSVAQTSSYREGRCKFSRETAAVKVAFEEIHYD
jgi:hypothetical protein